MAESREHSIEPRIVLAGEPADAGAGNDGGVGYADPGAVFGGDAGGNGGSGGGSVGDDFTFDPERHAGPDKRNRDGSFRRKRGRDGGGGGGRKAGSRARVRSLEPDAASAALFSLHLMAASMLKAPDWALSQEEADKLGAAAAEVAKHYPVQLDPKIVAWTNLGVVAAMVYGPRVYNAMHEARARKKERGPAPRKAPEPKSPAEPPTVTSLVAFGGAG